MRSEWSQNLVSGIFVFVAIFGLVFRGEADPSRKKAAGYPSPERYRKAIEAFLAADKKNPPPPNAVLCIGSSSMRKWHASIRRDLAPLTVIPRGFGGSNMNDVLYFSDQIVLPYKPRAILLYEGDNDTAQRIPVSVIVSTYRKFIDKVHSQLPNCRIYVMAVKPSISRWRLWPAMQKLNGELEKLCSQDERLCFIDAATPLLGADGKPVAAYYLKDKLHMTRQGYEVWKKVVGQILIPREKPFEKGQ
ncbi:MAG: hypothetical protein D6820_09415 [Lentisphaerae bacterium]|nr:MAG: hypothetical protein D6820_09415 [Lentisphaerota bacterium]